MSRAAPPRVGLLASVADLAEMDIALAAGADIVDLKDPAQGALGAWAADALTAGVARWRRVAAGGSGLSATVGDLPLDPDALRDAAARTAAAGVPLVKIGFAHAAASPALARCIAALAPLARQHRLIAVLFADQAPRPGLIPQFAAAGFHGVMLDTADKGAGSLRTHLGDAALAAFVAAARGHGLVTGLAGSLRLSDIAPLTAIAPDYLGFRGALCAQGRAGALDADRLRAVGAALRRPVAAA